MPEPTLKSHRLYWFYRLYCVAAIVGWNAAGFWDFAHEFKPPTYMPSMVPIFLPALFMVFNWSVFPFKFSVFGVYKRTPFPEGEPLLRVSGSWGKIGWFRATVPFFTWSVYASGVGISILGVGKVFIPVECITELRSGRWWGRCKLLHDSPEVRSPVALPKEVFEAAQRIMPDTSTGSA